MNKKLLWTHTGVAAATGGSILRPFEVTGMSIDSRTTQKGDLFIALKAQRDGHYFVRNAIQNGASAAILSWKPKNLPAGVPIVFVKNTTEALEKLALSSRSRMRGKVIAITGTAGKTTTKEILKQILEKHHQTHASKGSFNNDLGVPVSLAEMPAQTEFGIFEIGMNHAGEITPLVKMVRPDVAIITTVGAGHLEFFESEQDIAKAKAEIFLGLKKGGKAVLNKDNKHYEFLQTTARELGVEVINFGKNADCDVQLISCENKNNLSHLKISIHQENFEFSTKLLGEHNALNICSIFAALHALVLNLNHFIEDLTHIEPASGRGNILLLPAPETDGQITFINESYNANPLSMQAALENIKNLRPEGNGLKIAVLGEMKELGDKSKEFHIGLKALIEENKFDRIYLIGSEPIEALYDALGEESPSICASLIEDVIEEIIKETPKDSIIFAKASHSIGLERLICAYQKNQRLEEEQENPQGNEE